jgi:tRNA A58 N-methylase Trm61
MGGKMMQMEDGDYCESSEVEQLEHVAQLVLVSPATGKPLEVCSDLLAEGPFTVFYVSNQEERFKVKISMEEM